MKLIPHKISYFIQQHSYIKRLILIGFFLSCSALGTLSYVDTHKQPVYSVSVGSQFIGLIDDPQEINPMLKQAVSKASAQYPDVTWEVASDQISLKKEMLYNPHVDVTSVANQLPQFITPVAAGVQIKADGKVIATLKDDQTAQDVLEKIKTSFESTKKKDEVTILSANPGDSLENTTTELTSLDFSQKVEVEPVDHIDPGSIEQPDAVLDRIQTGDVQPTTYTIQSGDCISCIAKKFNISRQLIYDNNPWLHADDTLHIGQVLDLTVKQPALTVVSEEKVSETLDIAYNTVYQNDDTMPSGKSELVTPGKKGQKIDTYLVKKANGKQISEQLTDEQVIADPVSEVIKRGTKIIPNLGTGAFGWPVHNPEVTSGYGMRWGSLHKGIDVISKTGDLNILAADNGTVTYAQFNNGGYGNCVLIDHHNGYVTRYAHLSTIQVKVGQTVEKGQVLGIMGETGDAEGIHVHFEVTKNEQLENPMGYLNK